jgi:hypothetical protein
VQMQMSQLHLLFFQIGLSALQDNYVGGADPKSVYMASLCAIFAGAQMECESSKCKL